MGSGRSRIPGCGRRRGGDQRRPLPPENRRRHHRAGRVAAAHVEPLQHRLATTAGAEIDTAGGHGPGVFQQLRGRSQRNRTENRPAAWLAQGHRAAAGGGHGERVPWPHPRHLVGQRRPGGAPGFQQAAGGFRQSAVRRPRRAGQGATGLWLADRGDPDGADPGRKRRATGATGLSQGRARTVQPALMAVDAR
ncbi:hypothetical protein D3C78_1246710 [compost metagenome]